MDIAKKFEKPMMEIILLSTEDVIVTSGSGCEGTDCVLVCSQECRSVTQ